MTWIVQSLINVILKGICGAIANLFDDYIKVLGINIGSDFGTVKNPNSFSTVITSYFGSNPKSSAFDQVLPLSNYKATFAMIAIIIAASIAIYEFVKVQASPLTGAKAQHPAKIVFRFFFTAIGVVFSYRFFLLMEYIGNGFYNSVAKLAMNDLKSDNMKNFAKDFGKGLTESFSSLNFVGGKVTSGENANVVMGQPGAMVAPTGDGSGDTDLGLLILSLGILFLVAGGLIKLLIEMIERYVTLGLLFYTCPLPFSTIVSPTTSGIFASWIQMVLSEMLLLITNSIFLSTSLKALIAVTGMKIGSSLNMSSNMSWLIFMLMVSAWLKAGRDFDAHLKGLGLSTVQTGSGVGGAIMGAAMSAVALGKGVPKIGKTIGSATKFTANATGKISDKLSGIGPSSKRMSDGPLSKEKSDFSRAGKEAGFQQAMDKAFGGKSLTGDAAKQAAQEMGKASESMGFVGMDSKMKALTNNATSASCDGKGNFSFTDSTGGKQVVSFGTKDSNMSPMASGRINNSTMSVGISASGESARALASSVITPPVSEVANAYIQQNPGSMVVPNGLVGTFDQSSHSAIQIDKNYTALKPIKR